MPSNRVVIKDQGLKDFIGAFDKKYVTRVGILGKKSSRNDEINNATLGAIHEFGSRTNNIPARSFLRFPLQYKSKDIVKMIMKAKSRIKNNMAEGDISLLFKLMGTGAESVIQNAFETRGYGQWKSNNPSTIKKKGSDSPLIDTAQLRRSITSEVKKNG